MKRNLMLLTAVVLVAVMLSGCALWPFGKIVVDVELPKNDDGEVLLEVKDLAKKGKYKKEAALELNFETTDEYDGEEFVVSFTAKKDDKPDIPTKLEKTDKGYKLEGKVGKKDLTIKITVITVAE